MVMMTSKNPGRLGLYGFRHRRGFSYTEGWIASSHSVREKTVWDRVGEAGRKVCVVGVPPSYPPKPVNGSAVSCFITPSAEKEYTYPLELKATISSLVGEYVFDVLFRTDDRDRLLRQLYEMTEKRFRVLQHLLTTQPWSFFMSMEIAVDRLHHAFWKFYDTRHPKYEAGNKYENVIPDFYRYLDRKIGELLAQLDKNTYVLVASDHGTKGMRGAFCVNQWLIEQGYLCLKHPVGTVTDMEKAPVDWEKTKAWGWGGYYARIFLNVKGREAQGTIEPADYESVRGQIASDLKAIRDPHGRTMDTSVHTPEQLYGRPIGDKPDLMVYFDDLYWRSAGTIGHSTEYLEENDTGPDDSVHAFDGMCILYDRQQRFSGRLEGARIYDIAPTLLHLMGGSVVDGMEGGILSGVA
jgi:predicted AlkP superfamily phosphohydrolase/phosphomutase